MMARRGFAVVGNSSLAGMRQPTVWQVNGAYDTSLGVVLPGLNAGAIGLANDVNNQEMIAGETLLVDTGVLDEQGNPVKRRPTPYFGRARQDSTQCAI